MNALAKRGGSGVDRSGFFNFRDESGTDNGGVRKTAEHGNVARQRDSKADSDRKLREAAGAAQERRQIVGQSIFRACNASARDEIENYS